MNFNPEGGAMQATGSQSPSWVASIILMRITRSNQAHVFLKIFRNDL